MERSLVRLEPAVGKLLTHRLCAFVTSLLLAKVRCCLTNGNGTGAGWLVENASVASKFCLDSSKDVEKILWRYCDTLSAVTFLLVSGYHCRSRSSLSDISLKIM